MKHTIFNTNIIAPAGMKTVMTAKRRHPLADDLFAIPKEHRPIARMLNREPFEDDIGGIVRRNAVNAAIIFFALGIVAVGTVDDRPLLSDNGDILGIENPDDRIIPRREGIHNVTPGIRPLGGSARRRPQKRPSLRVGGRVHLLHLIFPENIEILRDSARLQNGSAFKVKRHAAAEPKPLNGIKSASDDHAPAARLKDLVYRLLNGLCRVIESAKRHNIPVARAPGRIDAANDPVSAIRKRLIRPRRHVSLQHTCR